MTQKEFQFRPLGLSKLIKIKLNANFIFTGNNLDIRGDMKRRVVLIRFDAKRERPEQRKFKRDIIKYAKRNRGEIIKAALTIPLAYNSFIGPENP